jgi:hypothetical protein
MIAHDIRDLSYDPIYPSSITPPYQAKPLDNLTHGSRMEQGPLH